MIPKREYGNFPKRADVEGGCVSYTIVDIKVNFVRQQMHIIQLFSVPYRERLRLDEVLIPT